MRTILKQCLIKQYISYCVLYFSKTCRKYQQEKLQHLSHCPRELHHFLHQSFNFPSADCSFGFVPWFEETGVSSSKYAFSGRVPALAIVVSCRHLHCRKAARLTDVHSRISHFWSEFSVLQDRFFVLFGNCNDAEETAESGNRYHRSWLVR